MTRRVADGARAGRLAIVGAPSPDGTRLREALARSGVPGRRVDLYATVGGEVVLSEYAGEARLIQQPDVEEIVGHEVVFLCERGRLAEQVAAALGPGSAIVDLLDGLPGRFSARRVHAVLRPAEPAASEPAFYTVPHPVALLLVELLHPLQVAFGVEEAVAVVVRPASDFGEAGVEELREQTVRLLNFLPAPTETFGCQLAFNVVPERAAGPEPGGAARRIAEELRDLLGWPRRRAAVRLLTVPMFYGHGVQLRFRLERPAAVRAVGEALAGAGLEPRGDGPAVTPLELTGEAATRISDLAEDGTGGFWLWAVAGDAGAKAAEQAVSTAVRLAGDGAGVA